MPSTPVRSHKRAQKRDALAQAAATLFRAHGFEATTVDQIAAGAGVSRRTFFRYFPTKDAVVFPHAEERLDHFMALLEARPGETALRTVRRAARSMAEHFSLHRDELLLQHRLIESAPVLIARERDLDRRWEEGLAQALSPEAAVDRRTAALAGAVVGAMRALLRGWYAEDAQGDLPALVDEALDLLAPAFEEDA